MRKPEQRLLLKGMTAVVDGAAVAAAWLAAYGLRFEAGLIPMRPGLEVPPWSEYIKVVPPAMAAWWALLAARGLYGPEGLRRRMWSVVTQVSTMGMLLMAAAAFFYRSFEYSRAVALLAYLLTIALLLAGRALVGAWTRALQRGGFGVSTVVIVGAGKLGRMVEARLAGEAAGGTRVAGFVDDAEGLRGASGVLGTTAELERILADAEADEVILALPFRARDKIMALVRRCESRYVRARVIPDFFELLAGRVQVASVAGLPMIGWRESPLSGWNVLLKQGFDVLVAAALLVVLAPVLLLIAAVIRLTSPGPALYRQERVGRDGKTFMMLKFRTMRADAEAASGPVWATPEDPRRTPVGVVLRRFSLDELPQLFNILRGEMSLVGPRPERPVFVRNFGAQMQEYFRRHRVKAGVTGWAQVHGLRGNTSIEERTVYDLHYVEEWSLWLDLKILAMTAWHTLRGKNAY